jgi:glycerol-3-phosphate dehydrogenase
MPPGQRVDGHRRLSRREALAAEPLLPAEGLTGAVVFPEWHMYSSERMTLAVVESAVARGAAAANEAEVVGFLGDERRVEGVRVADRLTGEPFEVRSRIVVNAAGPWAFDLLARRAGADASIARRMAHSKGCHVVVDAITGGHALALATKMANESLVNRGGRHIFLIPWRDRTLIGTTNVPHEGPPDALAVTEKDVDDFVAEIRTAIPAADVTRDRVQHAFGGLYPLVDTEVQVNVYQGSGKYRIVDHGSTDGVDGLVTALGAKYTTARRAAEKGVDLVVAKLGTPARPCATPSTPLVGGGEPDRERLLEAARRDPVAGVGEDSIADLVYNHGTGWREPLAAAADDPDLATPVAPGRPTTGASVRWAAREEMANRLADVVFRRTGLGTIGHPGSECLRKCARILGDELGWSETRREEEVAQVEAMFRRSP